MPREKRSGPDANRDRPAKNTSAAAKQGSTLGRIVRLSGPWRADDLPLAIARRIVVHPVSGCWVWTGRTDRDGYGRLGGKGVHRIAYRHLVGPIPPEAPQLDHVEARGCLFRACCWPAHLEPVTARTNTLRGRSFAAVNAAKVACDHGHPYDEANTYWYKGRRDCRACVRRRVAAYQRRQRQAASAA